MRNKEKDARQKNEKRAVFLEAGFQLFAKYGIDAVSLQDVADATSYGIATLYRSFEKKPGFVVEVAAAKWDEMLRFDLAQSSNMDFTRTTAAEDLDYYLESFLELYRNHQDILRFNQFFNIYVHSLNLDANAMRPYQDIIRELKDRFYAIYDKALRDRTLRTDEPRDAMFSTATHLILAAVTRYAVGLIYEPEFFAPMKELTMLKDMLMDKYQNRAFL
ncbi:MAG: TetR/AcrR family transcriptional regulator [Lachnospiraceae bacterium]|nr:TetR/AcrR family transcriptional regulator [Lachnospiraceae bacterium]